MNSVARRSLIMENTTQIKVAILGATGYIGRSLVATADAHGFEIVSFSRDVSRAKKVFASYNIDDQSVSSYDSFLDQNFDVVINATGIGSPREITNNPTKVFSVTEEMDSLIFYYLDKYPNTRVFNISSGSVYGLSAGQPIEKGILATFDPSHLDPGNYYSLAKLHSEAKHRAWSDHNIVDLRVFAFISRWLDTDETFFIAEVANCLLNDKVFYTKQSDMVRDYCTADDLWKVIEFLCDRPAQNAVFDMQSKSPVAKFELLDHLSLKFGLKYKVSKELMDQSPTGQKNAYYSKSNALTNSGFIPHFTALENLSSELKAFLSL